MKIKSIAPKNFPITMFEIDKGLVSKSSKVPKRFSSEKLRIVIAGIKNNNTHGENLKKGDKSLYPEIRILKSPSITHKKRPFTNKNIDKTKYPIVEPKNDLNSLTINAFITYDKETNLSTLQASGLSLNKALVNVQTSLNNSE